MICTVIGKNSLFFGTNKSESFITRKRIKWKRHKKYKAPELLKLFRDLKPGPKAAYPSIDQIPSFQTRSILERERLNCLPLLHLLLVPMSH